MRLVSFAAAVAALMLAACDNTPAPPEPVATETITAFEDGGCIGVLMLQRAAVIEGRAEGDAAALTEAISDWRTAAATQLSGAELNQYEASSIAVEDDLPADVLADRAEVCVTTAPQN